MEKTSIEDPEWGTYAPPRNASFLLTLVKVGLARGKFSKWVRKKWRSRFPEIVDVESRGIRYRLNVSNNTTDDKILLSSKYYDGEEIEALAASGGKVFVDIGANTGYYSLTIASKGFDKVLSIEPNPPTVKRLQYNVEINNLQAKIKIVPLCVGSEGYVNFYCDGSLGSASVISENNNITPITIESKSLIDILSMEKISSIDGMKIDVEGIEDQVLIPFFETAPIELWPKVLVLEHCHQGIWKTNVIDYLLQGRYSISKKTRANLVLKKIQ